MKRLPPRGEGRKQCGQICQKNRLGQSWHWSNLHCCKWPKKGKSMQPSGHTGVSFEASNERCTMFLFSNSKSV